MDASSPLDQTGAVNGPPADHPTRPHQPYLFDLVSCVKAPSVVLSAPDGQIDEGGVQGWLYADRRLLSRLRITVNGFTALGLVELTRKRTRESLAHVLCEPCPTCAGRGAVKTARTVCFDILREILREARAFNAREYRVLASQPVIDLFQEEESASVAMLSDFIGKPISMQVETSYTQEQFDIVLM